MLESYGDRTCERCHDSPALTYTAVALCKQCWITYHTFAIDRLRTGLPQMTAGAFVNWRPL